jgi:hypothetical protein
MHTEFTKLTSKSGKETLEISTSGKITFLVLIYHKIKIYKFKKYLKFKEKYNLK